MHDSDSCTGHACRVFRGRAVAHGIKLQDDCRAGCELDMGHVSVGQAEVACHPEDGMQELA